MQHVSEQLSKENGGLSPAVLASMDCGVEPGNDSSN
jgi:hypothetical protein